MTDNDFTDLLVLGNGYSARLAAVALDPVVPVKTMVAPPSRSVDWKTLNGLAGQQSHSHIFLPRLDNELNRIDPDLLTALADYGLRFTPGSYRLDENAPLRCRRMFATRWQLDRAIEDIFRQRLLPHNITASVSGIKTEGDVVRSVSLKNGGPITVSSSTLVLDAMGTGSPTMETLRVQCGGVIDRPGNVVYVTQFFRQTETITESLPDPLIDCPHDFGAVAVMLYPAADGWFSVSMAIDATQKALVRELRAPKAFFALCRQNPHVAAWLDTAEPVGNNRIYINPRNTWNVGVFEEGLAPRNYLAVGDALTTMLPTLGANCSFAATHIRIVRDLLAAGTTELQDAFARTVREEQYEFFLNALAERPSGKPLVPYKASPRNRLSKRLKNRLRKSLGLNRSRIVKHLVRSSSL